MFKILIVIGWMCLLFVFTCTANLHDLLSHAEMRFHWAGQPDFTDLFSLTYGQVINANFLFQKTGHFFGFGVLALLLMGITKRRKNTLVLALAYAVLTEILQLYFARDGHLLDMGIDAFGIVLALYIYEK